MEEKLFLYTKGPVLFRMLVTHYDISSLCENTKYKIMHLVL